MNLPATLRKRILAGSGVTAGPPCGWPPTGYGSGDSGPISADLPLPPSTNHLFLTRGRRRVKTPAYRTWLALAVPQLRVLQRPERFPVELRVTLIGGSGLNETRDLDNILKPVQDAIVNAGVLPADDLRFVAAISAKYQARADGPAVVRVMFRSLDTDGLILSLAERVFAQSELLSRRAERTG